MSSGRTVEQFKINSSCTVRITYTGPIYPILLFAPGVDTVSGTPFYTNSNNINPKVFTISLTTAGKWSIVINHQITSAFGLSAYTIKV